MLTKVEKGRVTLIDRLRRPASIALGLYVLLLCWILLNPSADLANGGVTLLTRGADAVGLPNAITTHMEEMANVAIFVPLPLLGPLVIGRPSATGWVSLAFAASLAVEVSQRLLLSGRSGSASDVVANTIGGLVGAGIAWLAVRRGKGSGRSSAE